MRLIHIGMWKKQVQKYFKKQVCEKRKFYLKKLLKFDTKQKVENYSKAHKNFQ